MRIVFMGTPDFAVPALKALHAAGHTIAAAYTQPPRPAGRGRKLQPSPVQREAETLGIPVHSPASLKPQDVQDTLAEAKPDVAVVAAYGLILPQAVLDIPACGCLNIHASLLPKWRGAAPIQRAILAGDAVTGVTIMQMEAGLDTGPMLATARTPVERKTAGELTAELAEMGAQLMVGTLIDLPALQPVPQDDAMATHAPKIDKAEARIDWSHDAEAIERQVRAFAPFPGAWFTLGGERIKLLAADVIAREGKPGVTLDDDLTIACGYAALRPTRIQRAGKPAMDVAAFLRGRAVPAGTMVE
ncbi:methionyl-tRNA formyltransferase [Pelagerythrobacter marinus]|uniref:methionyl-tRNA formyltransferase n=1 Tax=Pelagerythrobacter marinus TaxID=538382 RepID=UPI002036DF9E|nr:methionyl-tRNA formyltransferase [Pelagerythrobacter marinus]USA41015.1 methionyl-tRNA formyltransferase [Pelagerythrobacter marinus]WPZ08453.1 methionyl-tRNA formyltransferase [Pelagerythrobacter marinus]